MSSFSEPASRRRRRLLLRGFPRARDAASSYSDDTTEESVSWAVTAPPSSPRSSKDARWTGVGQPKELSPPQVSVSAEPALTPGRSSGEEPLGRSISSWVSPYDDDSERVSEAFPNQPSSSTGPSSGPPSSLLSRSGRDEQCLRMWKQTPFIEASLKKN